MQEITLRTELGKKRSWERIGKKSDEVRVIQRLEIYWLELIVHRYKNRIGKSVRSNERISLRDYTV